MNKSKLYNRSMKVSTGSCCEISFFNYQKNNKCFDFYQINFSNHKKLSFSTYMKIHSQKASTKLRQFPSPPSLSLYVINLNQQNMILNETINRNPRYRVFILHDYLKSCICKKTDLRIK